MILENLFGPFTERLQLAMHRAVQRHALLSANLANQSTPGYKRKDMSFFLSLEEAGLREQQRSLRITHPNHISESKFFKNAMNGIVREERSIRQDGNSVDLEREVAALTETQLHYSTLSEMARRYFQSMHEVIKEGRST
ncbi:MAG TPA: flagellar basal body rod protein FlgB [Fimbriimonadales bacterium]|nr:flagellar basal body rod protein FlgB [Fimbriimonadales bacterium]